MKKAMKKILIIGAIVVAIISLIAVYFFVIEPNFCKKQIVEQLDEIMAAPAQLIENEETPAMITFIEDRNGYELISVNRGWNSFAAKFKVFAPDVYSAVKKIEENEKKLTTDNVEEYVLRELEKAQIVETEVTLVCEKKGGKWTPILTSDFVDAYYGGTYRLQQEYLMGLVGEK